MIRRLILSPDALVHLTSAIWWYQNKGANLAFRFSAEAEKTLLRIARNPYQFRLLDSEVRRALMTRFPYAIYFTLKGDNIIVIAVFHQRRSVPVTLKMVIDGMNEA